MRIDSFISSYTPERSPRPGSAVTPFREAQREVEARREQPAAPASTQGFESVAQPRTVEASNASVEMLSTRQTDNLYQPPLHNRAAQALASYATTASFVSDLDAHEVMGLDLYA
ncbi:hypothetical protein [Pseudomonas sp. TTU2014-080ASC]|uniref:hypothetical protein n=1 Tax=Pseudomonas sp. TTU2014-080ASC TaxID=1729724 RepID=UPI0007188E37|nr:hypothetical protein [Pseudomonas sp. TTU2014-080ASC]KRW59337.1 hypothetical protein AO726_10940 [Pseudomonas sp. TTU2014-080ASC]